MKKLILGTDWWSDCDDAVAIRLLANAHKKGEIELLGISVDACMEHSVQALSAFLYDMELTDIPIGIDLEATDFHGKAKYQKMLCAYPSVLKSNAEAENAVSLLRRLLAQSPEKVDLIEIGFTQVFADLFDSAPDAISPLTGAQLVAEKVGTLWCMAGNWNEDGGREHNFCNNARSIDGGRRLCEKWSGEIVFLGWEVGAPVLSGGKLDKNDLLYKVLENYGCPDGRCSWDPMTALLAVTGDIEKAGYTAVRGKASLDEDGGNHFVPDENGRHTYVVKAKPDSYYADQIDERI